MALSGFTQALEDQFNNSGGLGGLSQRIFGVNPNNLPAFGLSSTSPDGVGPGTPRSVSSIKSKLLRPATTSHFYASIGGAPAPVMALLGSSNVDKLNLLCAETVLPGSNLTTWKVNNDFTGVTETYAYRRLFDERINLNFYVDADNYLPIRFFEEWISYIMGEDIGEDPFAGGSGPLANQIPSITSGQYNYRSRYPGYSSADEGYMAHQGLEITKFERDYQNSLTYRFVNSYPLAINSMPISYDGSQLLKCSVSMSYLRYVVVQPKEAATAPGTPPGAPPVALPSDPVKDPVAPSVDPGKIASGMMIQRGILGRDVQNAIRRQGLPLNTNRVRYWGRGASMKVEAL